MAKKIAYSAMLIALGIIFSYVEHLIPFSFGVPGIKLGLSNLVIVVGIFLLPKLNVLGILVARIVLAAFLFGNMSSLLYSLAGGLLSFAVMCLLKRMKGFSQIGISMAGGVFHNVGQVLVAFCAVESSAVFYYMPVLLIAGVLTGALIGLISQRVLLYLEKYKG